MALHDLWHFENAPVGLNLSVAAYQTTYNANTIYTQYAGNTGQPMSFGTGNTFSVSSDGFLVNQSNASGQSGAVLVPTTTVQDWSVATQYWVGFRTKALVAAPAAVGHIVLLTNNTSYSTWVTALDESHLIAAGLAGVGVEHYVEIFFDRSAMVFQTYVDGLLVLSGTMNTNTFSVSSLLSFGSINAGTANAARGFRDFYFLDVDANNPGRLGPLRAKAATLSAVSGSEWTPNGAVDLPTALGTAIQNPPLVTPNVQSPLDSQPLSLTLATNVLDSGQKVLAVQPTLSYTGANGNVAKLNAVIQDAANNSESLGQFVNTGALILNQKLPWQLKGPDGLNWTAAKINQSKYILTPTT